MSRFISWETLRQNERTDLGIEVCCEESFKDKTHTFVELFNEATITEVKNMIDSKNQDLFDKCVNVVHEFLRKDPFQKFMQSMYYHRYLQWGHKMKKCM